MDNESLSKDVAELIERLAREAESKRPPTGWQTTIAGRTYRIDGSGALAETYPVPQSTVGTYGLGTPEAVAQVAARFLEPGLTVIRVGFGGIFAGCPLQSAEPKYASEFGGEIKAPYYTGDFAPDGEVSILELLAWLDRFPGRIGASLMEDGDVDTSLGDAIRGALGTIRFAESSEVKIQESGAVIDVSYSDGAKLSGNGKIPRFIAVSHLRGSVDFETGHLYAIRILPQKSGGISVKLRYVDSCGAHRRWVTWALDRLVTALGPEWCIVEGNL